MESVSEALNKATSILKSLNGNSLTADHLDSIVSQLDSVDVNELLGQIPEPPGTGLDDVETKNKFQQIANDLNKTADAFNDELERIKRMRSTLNLDALDPVIQSAKRIIQPVFNFTADLEFNDD
ncbi:hypothetical protein [Pollutibacter soli]|uniref:hypothetical protein n=1 Tax=Pollutibacter soli TaxID=3034157 RepID=UPI0030140CBC